MPSPLLFFFFLLNNSNYFLSKHTEALYRLDGLIMGSFRGLPGLNLDSAWSAAGG